MPGRGPSPKPHHQRERDTLRRQAGSVALVPDGELRGPSFPSSIIDPHAETLVYWDTWRRSPNAQLFEATDWEGLKRAALLHDYVWKSSGRPSAAAVSELRLIEERYGASYVDRQRAKIHIQRDGADVVQLHSVGISGASRAGISARLVHEDDRAPF